MGFAYVKFVSFLCIKKVIAITVFCLLAVAYYAFFAPFVGGRIWEFILLGLYSPVVCSLLYPFLLNHKFELI